MLRALRSRPPFFQNSSIGDDHTLCADVQNSEQNLQNDPVSVEAVDFPQANRLRRTRSSDDIRTDQSRPCRRKRARKIARRFSRSGNSRGITTTRGAEWSAAQVRTLTYVGQKCLKVSQIFPARFMASCRRCFAESLGPDDLDDRG